MECLHFQISPSMNSPLLFLSSSLNFIPKISHFSSIQIVAFNSTLSTLTHNTIHSPSIPIKPIWLSSRIGRRVGIAKISEARLKEDWLASLYCPLPKKSDDFATDNGEPSNKINVGPDSWVIGVDPDVSGALALLKGNGSTISAQVFDSPHIQVPIGRRVRRRLDAKSIVQLVRSFDAPIGTAAYIEQSIPFPQDGKQGWWGGGFGYGLWTGILVAMGFSVVPVPSTVWKKKLELSGNGSNKDDSRRVASELFPLLSSELKRKKDHGRAEALLIAAYGKDLNIDLNSPLA